MHRKSKYKGNSPIACLTLVFYTRLWENIHLIFLKITTEDFCILCWVSLRSYLSHLWMQRQVANIPIPISASPPTWNCHLSDSHICLKCTSPSQCCTTELYSLPPFEEWSCVFEGKPAPIPRIQLPQNATFLFKCLPHHAKIMIPHT